MSGKIVDVAEENGPEAEKMLQKEKSLDEEKMIGNNAHRRLTEYCASLPLTDETSCGLGFCRGPLLQRFANKKAFVILYGILGCIFSACYAYFNGTITTIEKRFRISSKTSALACFGGTTFIGLYQYYFKGLEEELIPISHLIKMIYSDEGGTTETRIITVGNDISQLFITILLSYYAGRGHRPRWVAVGIYTVVVFCIMNALPHFLYGPGHDALLLTKEFGGLVDSNLSSKLIKKESRLKLCQEEAEKPGCNKEDGSMAPALILFTAQLISGFGGSLYYTLGVSYMDDNIKKSKTPALISFSYFLRMLGPAIGYSLASLCLKFYISPSLTPTITTADPRWLGAWWLGWLILGTFLAIAAGLLALFPKTLPRAAARRLLAQERAKAGVEGEKVETEMPASLHDLLSTFKRLIMNPTLTCNNLASVFYFIGFLPYWIFLPKYIETMYKQSASFASLITGTVGLVFSAIGILVSGVVITRCKPSARSLAMWNVFVGIVSIAGVISYIFLGCPANDNHLDFRADGGLKTKLPCNEDCHCDYVKYSPVCSPDQHTYISPCHAGCQDLRRLPNGTKVFTDCKCVEGKLEFADLPTFMESTDDLVPDPESSTFHGSVMAGPCAIDCSAKFYMFLAVVCILKFSGATGRTSNFLVSVRCVEEKDKPVAIALGMTIVSLLAFIPSPILFGYIIDKTCLVWGKTCTGTGNCWLYNGESLRYILNITSACFVTIGTFFDAGVWFYVKDLQVFDDEEEEKNGKKSAKR